MAEAGPKWPGPVTFNDDDPKKGFATVFLSIPNLTVKKKLLGPAEPKNAEIDPSFDKGAVCINVTITEADGKQTAYQYKKSMPEDIDAKMCTFKVKKERVVMQLCKLEQQSWGAHAKYMVKKE